MCRRGVNAYNIAISKSGYSSDKTYTKTAGNPNPTKPDATIAQQQVTQVSFAIDRVSTFAVQTVSAVCAPLGNVGFTVSGAKTIGLNLLKYSSSQTTNSGGLLSFVQS